MPEDKIMSNTTKNTTTTQDPKAAKRAANLSTVLGLATTTAQAELGDADNKTVTAAATLNVTSTEGDTTDNAGTNASVTVGTTSSTVTKDAAK
jgi:cytochrome bd-type quinol oxidase subunit 1